MFVCGVMHTVNVGVGVSRPTLSGVCVFVCACLCVCVRACMHVYVFLCVSEE